MKNYLIYDNTIAGVADQTEELPNGFTIATGADLPIERLYFDGETIQEKPPQPTAQHQWDGEQRSWLAPPSSDPPVANSSPDWDGLANWIRGSIYFERCYVAAKISPSATAAAALLLVTINTTHNLQDLAFVLGDILAEIEAIAGTGAIEAFTAEEKSTLAEKLNDLGFPDEISLRLRGKPQ